MADRLRVQSVHVITAAWSLLCMLLLERGPASAQLLYEQSEHVLQYGSIAIAHVVHPKLYKQYIRRMNARRACENWSWLFRL